MSPRRLLSRAPSATLIGAGALAGHLLTFHKRSLADGSGKCDALRTGMQSDRVFGVVFDVPQAECEILDKVEGVGVGYRREIVEVELGPEISLTAFTYTAILIDPLLRPFDWYLEHVIRGAREHALPAEYIRMLHAVECVADQDDQRRERERSIYR